MPHILIVDDSDLDRLFIEKLVTKHFHGTLLHASSGADALARIAEDHQHDIAAVLLDLHLPDITGAALLPEIHALRPQLAVIAVTGSHKITDAVTLIRQGAADYLTKPVDEDLLFNALSRALHMDALNREIKRLTTHDSKVGFDTIIGKAPAFQTCIRLAQRAAQSDITVLVTGESGTGKELIARAIHEASLRQNKPFVAVNCGALPANLVESTLFGHKKGAFTGAFADAAGKFMEADGGTLFLDEVGELPLETQVKLLRALQERVIEPVGSAKSVPVNLRVIAATNRDPSEAVRLGLMREDLYYRLHVFPLHMPALRDRRDDIQPLANHFLRRYARAEHRPISGFTPAAEKALVAHTWPGNVRELENAIFRAVLLCDEQTLDVRHLDFARQKPPPAPLPTSPSSLNIALLDPNGIFKPIESVRREVEQAALHYFNNDTALAARHLGIGRSTLYRHQQE